MTDEPQDQDDIVISDDLARIMSRMELSRNRSRPDAKPADAADFARLGETFDVNRQRLGPLVQQPQPGAANYFELPAASTSPVVRPRRWLSDRGLQWVGIGATVIIGVITLLVTVWLARH